MVLALLVGCAVGGTVAWLVAGTTPLVNTFAPGNITLSLSEPHWQTNYVRPEGNVASYKFLPGDRIDKDPTVTVHKGSVDCYVRLFMVIWWQQPADGEFQAEESDAWFQYLPHEDEYTGWWTTQNCISLYDHVNNNVLGIVKEFRYSEKIESDPAQDQQLRPLFDYIQAPTNLSQTEYASLDNFKLIIFAQAVQAEGFDSAADAFAQAGLPDVFLEECKNARGPEGQTLADIVYVLENQATLYPYEP